MTDAVHPVVWLHHAGQRLGLVPTLGGGVAAWQADDPEGVGTPIDLWRPWDGAAPDLHTFASFAMVPWSNRISGGGFTHAGRFHPVRPNRTGEPYPIHGDGWLQPWHIGQPAVDTVKMRLRSERHGGNPYDYECVQTFRLVPGGLDQAVSVVHLGADPLPYGLGLHPWFLRTPASRITAPVDAVWLGGPDPLPVALTRHFPPGWDLNAGVSAQGSLIDNAYTGWGGTARIEWPERGLQLTARVPDFVQDGGAARHFCLVYRPPQGPTFCFEPITHPIDAFHQPGQPGLRVLARGESLALQVEWRYGPLADTGGPAAPSATTRP